MLRIIAIADIHEDEVFLEKFDKIKEMDYDYLLVAGDIGQKNRSYAEEFVSKLEKGKDFFVPGNNEEKEILEIMDEYNIHGKRVEIKDGFNVVGFGYSNITPFNTPGELPEERMYKEMSKIDINEKTILLTHCPPKGVLDNGYGCEAVRKIIEERSPLINVFGHIHEIEGSKIHKKTICINLPPAYSQKFGVVEIEGKIVNFYVKELEV